MRVPICIGQARGISPMSDHMAANLRLEATYAREKNTACSYKRGIPRDSGKLPPSGTRQKTLRKQPKFVPTEAASQQCRAAGDSTRAGGDYCGHRIPARSLVGSRFSGTLGMFREAHLCARKVGPTPPSEDRRHDPFRSRRYRAMAARAIRCSVVRERYSAQESACNGR